MRKYRDKKINFRLLEDEYVYIKSLQKESGLNLSQYIIRCCMNKKIKKINGLKETPYELNKIGNNLNQLTKKIHQSRAEQAVQMCYTLSFGGTFPHPGQERNRL